MTNEEKPRRIIIQYALTWPQTIGMFVVLFIMVFIFATLVASS